MLTHTCLSYNVIFNAPHLTRVSRLSEFPQNLHVLQDTVRSMRRMAFREGTRANQRRQINLYLAFCAHYNIRDINPTSDTVAMYIAYLTHRMSSSQSVANYMSGVRLLHKLVGVDAPALRAYDMHLMMRSAKICLRRPELRRLPFTPADIDNLCQLCAQLAHKASYVFPYYMLV